ncbi:MAG: hypothetical protein QOJ40_2996 [Verrucomicrobiota bacterium]
MGMMIRLNNSPESAQKKEGTNMNRIKNHRTAARLVFGAGMAGSLLGLPVTSWAAAYSYTDLNPSGFTSAFGNGISGGQQVGDGDGPATESSQP